MIDALFLDLSGVLYDGETLIPGAREAVERVQRSDLELRFVTNTSQRTRADLLQHLHDLGFTVQDQQLFTAVDAARQWLLERRLRPFCLVHENILSEFADMDQNNPNAVFIADAVDGFNYRNLNRAFQVCQAGAPLLGVGTNRYYKSGDELLMDVGGFIRAVEFAAGVEATIVGKPSAEFFRLVLASTSSTPERTMMVGDDVFGDVEGALRAGIGACLVRTGKYQPGDEQRIEGEFQLVDSIEGAVDYALS
ncbi:TIGR01458 family HAD-type hydrolase [Seongchinamella unica]|uniref:Haloacid dehalogenase-like hydrolase domain-containing protein 2 n=1 Tax=Seongchinamella unica TaxID=2547392 RepID=A0A4R5LN72_9GAMM|nr:TIGR01458 family HAD-type hydrolase [Seongchinamella unica]TDG11404.1 TIGR01458 family HAD-type hydrolase [Seongchinamella unica]